MRNKFRSYTTVSKEETKTFDDELNVLESSEETSTERSSDISAEEKEEPVQEVKRIIRAKVINTDNLNVRTNPHITGSIITTLKKDSIVDVVNKNVPGWFKIQFTLNNVITQAYAMKEYLLVFEEGDYEEV